jgi:transcriptional regulator with XRE-family HTH domain
VAGQSSDPLLSQGKVPAEPTPVLALGSRVARNLALYRQRAGLTQQQLAELAKVSRATVNLIESGDSDPRLSTLELLANALRIDTADLTEHAASRRHLGEGI